MNNIIRNLLFLTLSSLVLLGFVIYKDNSFKNNPLPKEITKELYLKNEQLKAKIRSVYKVNVDIPIIISDELPDNLFGMAAYKNKKIAILLNKNRFQENKNYMIHNVLPHEYAHALMFYFGNFDKTNGGHTKRWEQICIKIGGIKCDRFVGHDDILIEKIGGLY